MYDKGQMNELNVYDIKSKKKLERIELDGKILKCLDLRDIVNERNRLLGILGEDRFKSIKVETTDIANNKEYTYYVVDDGLPVFQVNEFLDTKKHSKNTARKYSNIMSRFLNYLNQRNIEYFDVDNNVVEDFVKFRIYGGNSNQRLLKSTINYKTVMDDISVIKAFYLWFSKRCNRLNISFYSEKRNIKNSFLYAEIGAIDGEEIISKHLHSLGESKEYIKWYTEEQVEVILSNFSSTRDKAIFLCTLDGGMRIDEVLSVKCKDYDFGRECITPTRSKSTKLRTVKLSKRACNMIEDYLLGEREDAEYNSNINSQYLFINIKKGENQGKCVGYGNFLKILKRAAKRAGLPENQIKTHSGRSSKTMEYLKAQVRYPELNLTDSQIATNMGWENINTIKHYKDHQNEELGLMAHEKILKAKEKEKCKE